MTYEFDLLISANELTDELGEAVFEAGCDDATPWSDGGVVGLSFDREAGTFLDAVVSAIENVRSADIGVEAVRIGEAGSLVNASSLGDLLA